MDFDNSILNTNNLIPFSVIDKLFDSIAFIKYKSNKLDPKTGKFPDIIGTGFFIKLKLKEKITPYLCTANHVIEEKLIEIKNTKISEKKGENYNKISLELNKKDKNNNNIIIQFSCDEREKNIISCDYDIKFIEILEKEIKDIPINYLELEKNFLDNPIKYIGLEVIMAGYPLKYFSDAPLLSYGKILKIKKGSMIVYNMETDNGSSGSPVCIVNEKKELKLIGIHTQHDEKEKKNYNEGILFGPILRNILNYNVIEINNDDDMNKINNIIQNIIDKFDDLINKEKKKREKEIEEREKEKKEMLKNKISIDINQIENVNNNSSNIEFQNIPKPKIFYNEIDFYTNAIEEECKKLNKERFSIFFNIIKNHILIYAYELFEENMNKILTILDNFADIKSTYNMIRTFNSDIINNFNKILLSKDYDLKSWLIYFIAAYRDTLDSMNCRYNYKIFKLSVRTTMNAISIHNIIDHKNNYVAFKFFIDKIIPDSLCNKMYKKYADIKFSLNNEYKKVLNVTIKTDYDTRIYIEHNNKNPEIPINCFQISSTELVIEPFTLFKIKEESTVNDDEQTADIYLELVTQKSKLKNVIEILPELI